MQNLRIEITSIQLPSFKLFAQFALFCYSRRHLVSLIHLLHLTPAKERYLESVQQQRGQETVCTRAPGMARSGALHRLLCICEALLSVIFCLLNENSPTEPPSLSFARTFQNRLMLLCSVIQGGSGLERVCRRWKVSGAPHRRRSGSHGSDGVGVSWRQRGGKRSQQGDGHDEFMSHIIDWQPCCACCGNRFSSRAGETRDFTRSLH